MNYQTVERERETLEMSEFGPSALEFKCSLPEIQGLLVSS